MLAVYLLPTEMHGPVAAVQVDVRRVDPGDIADCAPALAERSADPALVPAIGLAGFVG